MRDKYEQIISFICKYKGVTKEELFRILKDKECKYILLLLLKKYDCVDIDKINGYFQMGSKRSFNYGFKKAQEKFL